MELESLVGTAVWLIGLIKHCVEQDRLNIWVSATTPSSSGSSLAKKESFTLAYMCSKCHRMIKHNSSWSLAGFQGVTMQYGHERETFLVFLAESSPLGMCRTFVLAAAVAHNVHLPSTGDRKGDGCYQRAMERQSADSMDRSAEYMETGQGLFWNDVEMHTKVERVQRPDLPDGFRFHTPAPTLMPVDHKAQRATYDMAEMVAEDCRKFCPPLPESDWCEARLTLSAFMSEELRVKLSGKLTNESKRMGWEPACWPELLICVKREANKPASPVCQLQ